MEVIRLSVNTACRLWNQQGLGTLGADFKVTQDSNPCEETRMADHTDINGLINLHFFLMLREKSIGKKIF